MTYVPVSTYGKHILKNLFFCPETDKFYWKDGSKYEEKTYYTRGYGNKSVKAYEPSGKAVIVYYNRYKGITLKNDQPRDMNGKYTKRIYNDDGDEITNDLD
ncbi:hypothetical protein FACS189472_07950 [Alphaproteobacteria bacterium]|nr:hypothetical protein FACS189472_07950 [Alphaproteobacteria bacterium]